MTETKSKSRIAIAMIKEDPQITALEASRIEHSARINTRKMFITKQMKDLMKENYEA